MLTKYIIPNNSLLVASLLLTAWVSGCSSQPGNTGRKNPSPNPTGDLVSFDQQWSGSNSRAKNSKNEVIRTEEQWRAIWAIAHGNETPLPKLPELDFQTQMVIAAFMGEKSSGGHSIEITKIKNSGNGLTVLVHELSPGPNAIRTAALTSPFHLAVIPLSEGDIKFVTD